MCYGCVHCYMYFSRFPWEHTPKGHSCVFLKEKGIFMCLHLFLGLASINGIVMIYKVILTGFLMSSRVVKTSKFVNVFSLWNSYEHRDSTSVAFDLLALMNSGSTLFSYFNNIRRWSNRHNYASGFRPWPCQDGNSSPVTKIHQKVALS